MYGRSGISSFPPDMLTINRCTRWYGTKRKVRAHSKIFCGVFFILFNTTCVARQYSHRSNFALPLYAERRMLQQATRPRTRWNALRCCRCNFESRQDQSHFYRTRVSSALLWRRRRTGRRKWWRYTSRKVPRRRRRIIFSELQYQVRFYLLVSSLVHPFFIL